MLHEAYGFHRISNERQRMKPEIYDELNAHTKWLDYKDKINEFVRIEEDRSKHNKSPERLKIIKEVNKHANQALKNITREGNTLTSYVRSCKHTHCDNCGISDQESTLDGAHDHGVSDSAYPKSHWSYQEIFSWVRTKEVFSTKLLRSWPLTKEFTKLIGNFHTDNKVVLYTLCEKCHDLFDFSAEHRNQMFVTFRQNNFRANTSPKPPTTPVVVSPIKTTFPSLDDGNVVLPLLPLTPLAPSKPSSASKPINPPNSSGLNLEALERLLPSGLMDIIKKSDKRSSKRVEDDVTRNLYKAKMEACRKAGVIS